MSGPLSQLHSILTDLDRRHPIGVGVILVLIIAVAVFSGAYRKPFTTPPGCPELFQVADNISEHHVFGAGIRSANSIPISDRAIGPGYPFLLAILARADPHVAKGLDCAGLSLQQHQAGEYFESLRILQSIAGIGILLLMYFIVDALTGKRAIALSSVVLYVIGGKLGKFARTTA